MSDFILQKGQRFGQEPITPRTWKSPGRQRAIERGIQLMLDASGEVWGTSNRVDGRLQHLLDSFAGCGHDAYMRKVEHIRHGPSYRPSGRFCHEVGHEECAQKHAEEDLKKWEHAFNAAYGGKPMAVVEFYGPRLGPRAMRKHVEHFKNNRKSLAALLGCTIGFIGPVEDGAVYRVLVRRAALGLLFLARQLWREEVPGGYVRVRRVAGWARPIDLAVELRLQAEQSLFLLVAEGRLSPERGRAWMAESLDEDGHRAAVRRAVFGPGFCALQRRDNFRSMPDSHGKDPKLTAWEPCDVCGDPRCGQREATGPGSLVTHEQVRRKLRSGELIPVCEAGSENPLAYVSSWDLNYLVRHGLTPVHGEGGRVVRLEKCHNEPAFG